MATLPYPATMNTSIDAAGSPIAWQTQDSLAQPTGVALDDQAKVIIVANTTSGVLSRFAPDGSTLSARWVEGLQRPTGLQVAKGKLYVVGGNTLTIIDVPSAAITKRIVIPDAQSLVDVVVDAAGIVYAADPGTGAIYSVDGETPTVFFEGDVSERPTAMMVMCNQIFVASESNAPSNPGKIFALNIKSKQKTMVTPSGIGQLAGLTRDERFNFLVAERSSGAIYQVSPKGDVSLLLAGITSVGGLLFLNDRRWLVVSRTQENSLIAYDITRVRR